MYFYEVGYHDYDCSPNTVLWHTIKFTQDEFNEMTLNCYVKASKEDESEHNIKVGQWKKSEDEEFVWKYYPRVSDLHTQVTVLLVTDYGFHTTDAIARFDPEDERIVSEDGCVLKEEHCEYLNMLRERFNVIEPRDNKINEILKHE